MLTNNPNNDAVQRMASDPLKKKGVLNRFAKTVKNSPKFVRKAFGTVKKQLQVGKNEDHSTLKNCQANGWLYKDEDIHKGVNYKVKYLGSVEVDYDAASTENNQEAAQKAMRALYAHSKNSGNKNKAMALSLSVDRICLTDLVGKKIVMRHSTTRIAYSTVDTAKPKVFAYVAMVKNTKLALCHVFSCKSPKQGYEMTFVCAQAFDMNYRRWKDDSSAAKDIATKTEETDVEPAQAWQKKKEAAKAKAEQDKENASTGTAAEIMDDCIAKKKAKAVAPPPPKPVHRPNIETKPGVKVFLAIQDGQDPASLAENYFKSLGIEMIEDEEDFGNFATSPLRSASGQCHMQLGVDPETYNASPTGGGGYMTVGNFEFNDEDNDDDDDDDFEL